MCSALLSSVPISPDTCCDIARTCVASMRSVLHRNAIATRKSEKSRYCYINRLLLFCIEY